MTGQSLSISDKLVIAAHDLEERGQSPFSAEDLVVSAWKRFPDAFGLAGYRDDRNQLAYPDSNRVFAEIMGSKPIRKRGLLKKVGTKMYQLTESGREYARRRLPEADMPSTQKAALGRQLTPALKKWLASKVLEKFRGGRKEDITFYDACAFWGISPGSSAVELDGQLSNFKRVVEAAQDAIHGEVATFQHGGVGLTARDLAMLLDAHQYLQDRFRNELAVIRKRTDERNRR